MTGKLPFNSFKPFNCLLLTQCTISDHSATINYVFEIELLFILRNPSPFQLSSLSYRTLSTVLSVLFNYLVFTLSLVLSIHFLWPVVLLLSCYCMLWFCVFVVSPHHVFLTSLSSCKTWFFFLKIPFTFFLSFRNCSPVRVQWNQAGLEASIS